jgi:hypothetical protein
MRRQHPVQWRPVEVLPGLQLAAGAARCLQRERTDMRWLFGGLSVLLQRDEVPGYRQNLASGAPSWFVAWQPQGELAVPFQVTLSSRQAARLQADGAQVDSVPASADIVERLRQFVARAGNS